MDLRGKTVLITRAATQSAELRMGLESHGARVLECPAIEIVPVDDWTAVDRAAADLNSYQWIIFTSANAVEHFMPRVSLQGVTCEVPIATVGTATARKLQEWNLSASRIPASFRAEGLLDAFPADLRGERILIPRAERARELLPEELRRRGATVDDVPVYRTVRSDVSLADLKTTLSAERIDAVVFTSPSAIRSYAESLGDEFSSCLGSVPIAVIGPVAREAAESAGLKVAIQPPRATVEDLIKSIRTALTWVIRN
jgi:uroporphyrinogen III methyltransferase/synthase